MSAISPEQWREISPLLDSALSISEEERGTWLATLRVERPDLAEVLETLLDEHRVLAEERFLLHDPPRPNQHTVTGQIVGAYRLVSQIGKGGMGNVWLAERADGRFDRQVAVKFLHFALASQAAVERFKREGKILGQLGDPHIAELIDAGVTHSGEPYLVLEYVRGKQIDEYCDERTLEVGARVRVFLDVLSGVARAHANLTVHRDIKPSNVLVSDSGDVKLLDFGIAKLLGATNSVAATQLTLEGGGGMTPLFAAPEQVTGSAITTATDIYALGALLYLLLTGRHPLGPGPHSPAVLIKAIVDVEPPRASDAVEAINAESTAVKRRSTSEKLRRQLRGDLDTIIAKTLKKNPAERYSSVTALADDLRRYLKHEPISARPDTIGYRTAKFIRRNRTAVTLSALTLLATITGVSSTVIQARTARRQRDLAFRERDRANRISEFVTNMFKVADPSEARGNSVTAREILDKASKEIDPGLANDPGLQAEMMHVMGNVYRRLGLYSTAQSLLERSVDIGRRADGPRSPEVLSAMNDLATVLVEQTRPTDAEKLQREALDLEQGSLGPENPITLSTMSDLATSMLEEGRYAEAVDLATRVLQTQSRLLGTYDARTLGTMYNLAIGLGRAGHFAESERLQRQAIDVGSRALGPDSPEVLNAMGNLGATLIFMGRYAEAETILQQTFQAQKRVLGLQHPETAHSAYNLACVSARQGHRDNALTVLREAIDYVPPRVLPKIETDADLASLHGDPRWTEIVAIAKDRTAEAKKAN